MSAAAAEAIALEGERLLPPGPIEGPEAWYGPALAKRDDWIFRFDASELEELDAAVRSFADSGTPLAAITPANFPLPSLGPRLAAVSRELLPVSYTHLTLPTICSV